MTASLLVVGVAGARETTSGRGRLPCTRTLQTAGLGSAPYPGAAVQRAVAASHRGGVICLTAGFPNEIDLYNVHPSRPVTIEPAPGVTASQVGSYFMLNSVSNVRLLGMTVSFVITGNSTHDSVVGGRISAQSFVKDTPPRAAIQISYNTARGVRAPADNGVLNVVQTGGPACPGGVTVAHNLIDGTNGDGIDTMGAACDTHIVANVVQNIEQSVCGGMHCDGFQDNGGGQGTVLSGNMFMNDTDCWLLDDGSANVRIAGNVCSTSADSSYWMQFGGAATFTFTHNTVTSSTGATFGTDHQGERSSNVTFADNILYSAPVNNPGQPVPGLKVQYNTCGDGCRGQHNRRGRPRLMGGRQPTYWAGFRPAPRSPAVGSASDGRDRGVTSFVVAPGP